MFAAAILELPLLHMIDLVAAKVMENVHVQIVEDLDGEVALRADILLTGRKRAAAYRYRVIIYCRRFRLGCSVVARFLRELVQLADFRLVRQENVLFVCEISKFFC